VFDCLQARWAKRRSKAGERQLLQRGVVTNDRLFRQQHIYHGIDRDNPRVEVTVWRLDGQRDFADQGVDGFTTPEDDAWLNPQRSKESRDAKHERQATAADGSRSGQPEGGGQDGGAPVGGP
jgi:hypothetical protein